MTIDRYDDLCCSAGLKLDERFATWDKDPWQARGDYAVSVHRRSIQVVRLAVRLHVLRWRD